MAHLELVPKSLAMMNTLVHLVRGGWNLWPFPLWKTQISQIKHCSDQSFGFERCIIGTSMDNNAKSIYEWVIVTKHLLQMSLHKQSVDYHSHFTNVNIDEYQRR
jgi:hypothetical protein